MLMRWLKKITSPSVIAAYHWVLALAANRWHGRPSERLIVVGITGTSGKSTVVEQLSAILQAAGHRVGVASTIRFQVGERSWLNETKMTMVGRFQLQKLLAEMVTAGCRYALIETSSQGILQFRHLGIHYDAVALTNLYPEHLDAHGGFENYRAAKRTLFAHLQRSRPKRLASAVVPRSAVVNLDAPQAGDFLNVAVEQRLGFSLQHSAPPPAVTAVHGQVQQAGSRFGLRVDGQTTWLQLPGEHNVGNALCAYAVAQALGVPPAAIAQGLNTLPAVPGRIEFVRVGQSFTVVVDYAFEPVAMRKLYDVVGRLPHRRVIQVLGTTGGGRDRHRGEALGRLAGGFADVVVATDEDPYDDDPQLLAERVVRGAQAAGKVMGTNLILELDRRAAIRRALAAAAPNDVVLVTGKGCEQAMVVAGGRKIPWDDRAVVREEIARLQTAKR